MTSPSIPEAPQPTTVNKFHSNSDADVSKIAQHHTLGPGANQASPGDHVHDGKSSKILTTFSITGELTPTTVGEVNNVVNQLITLLQRFTDLSDNRL